MQLKLKLFMTLKNKKNILRNIKFKVKLLVFLPKLQKLFTKGGSAHLAIPRHAHYVSLGYPVPILKYLYFFCSYLDILCTPLQEMANNFQKGVNNIFKKGRFKIPQISSFPSPPS